MFARHPVPHAQVAAAYRHGGTCKDQLEPGSSVAFVLAFLHAAAAAAAAALCSYQLHFRVLSPSAAWRTRACRAHTARWLP